MKQILRITWKEFSYGIRSFPFWFTAIGLALLMLGDSLPDFYAVRDVSETGQVTFSYDILYFSVLTLEGGGYLFYLRYCMYVVPYGCSFCDEYSAGALKYRLTRGNSTVYGIAKMLAGMLFVTCSVFLAEVLYVAVLRMQGVEFLLPQKYETDMMYSYYALIANGHVTAFFFLLCFFKSLTAMYFSSMCLMLSAFVRNKYVLMAIPVTLFFCYDWIIHLIFEGLFGGLPNWLNWRVLFLYFGIVGEPQAEIAGTVRTAIYTLVSIVIFTVIFVMRIRKVAEQE